MIIEKKDNFHLDEDVVPGALKPLMEEFQDFILLRNTYHAAIREVSTKLEILDDEFQVRYDYNPIHHMECRLKSPRSLFEKLERKGLEIEIASIYQITDMAGIRVICNYIDDVYAVASLLLKQDDIKLIRRRDYIKEPKESGYRSLHLVVEIPVFLSDKTEMVPVEIQLRTIAMDTWASLEHELKYKRSGGITPEMEEELKDCANAMAEVDRRMEEIHKAL
ncbi:GTP pyrophosphokinase [Zhenpiania hominis]|uniref:GTP pyrophosphokinase family protein n=1 Tax=Zhenpiania hominis TaxID=2763644 RepID=A0A923NPI7_9FIRM|nr:GTP pyrophosphokinase family protein [Zhenpiania hominis]MBC6680734.1 GTP pyrophosphokinase family protein [Zhenpiania hominis]